MTDKRALTLTFWIMALAYAGLISLAAVLWLTLPAPAMQHYAGEYNNVDPLVRQWFKSVKSPRGVPCCDIADGHPTQYEKRADNHFWVPIEGNWQQVPDEAVVHDAGNPFDTAVVWYIQQGSSPTYFIRCFVPYSEI